MTYEQCPRCFGRGYLPENRKGRGMGFYARNCPRCMGVGSITIDSADYGYLQHGTGTDGPFRTERVHIKNEFADRWLAWFEGRWRRVHIQVGRLFIVCRYERITIQIEGV